MVGCHPYATLAADSPETKVQGKANNGEPSPKLINPIEWFDKADWTRPVKPRDVVVTKVVEGGAEAFRTFDRAVRDMAYS